MTIKQKRAAALKSAQELIDNAKAGGRDLTADEELEVKAFHDEIQGYDAEITRVSASPPRTMIVTRRSVKGSHSSPSR